MTKDLASLAKYVKMMKDMQEHIIHMASGAADKVKVFPSVAGLQGEEFFPFDVSGPISEASST